jgi:hypothetical protein
LIGRAGLALVGFALAVAPVAPTREARADDLRVEVTGAPAVVYDPARAACAPIDQPDMSPRAYRDASGGVTMFALHYVNRPLRGPDLDHVAIDCHVALDSPLDPDPAHYADRYYVASTWTQDGRDVSALIHHEYHADTHKRCRAKGDLACWYNTILAFHSTDGGQTFVRGRPLVVASAPFTQDIGQGRHRGFFQPSNMFSDGAFTYAFVSTTGWDGQSAGSCLLRARDPADPAQWRAYDGTDFTIRYTDPYTKPSRPKPCAPIAPFLYSLGAVVRDASSKTWIAVFQAAAGGAFPLDGFYYATARDLPRWSPPRLLMAGRTLYDDPCKGGASIINYPSVLDPGSPSRNFDVIADHPYLYYTVMALDHCQTGARMLVRQPLAVTRVDDKP